MSGVWHGLKNLPRVTYEVGGKKSMRNSPDYSAFLQSAAILKYMRISNWGIN